MKHVFIVSFAISIPSLNHGYFLHSILCCAMDEHTEFPFDDMNLIIIDAHNGYFQSNQLPKLDSNVLNSQVVFFLLCCVVYQHAGTIDRI